MDQTATGAFIKADGDLVRPFWADLLARLATGAFALWLALSLSTPSWRHGPFSWWPLVTVDRVGGAPLAVGPLMLLPALAAAVWVLLRLSRRARLPWRWGPLQVVLPLLAMTLLGVASLDLLPIRRTMLYGGSLAIAWFVLLFVLNRRPALTVPLSLAMLLQGGVAVGQFLLQRELGLAALGELSLDPTVEGIAVLRARGHPWLRAYGLTTHPNMLGAMLVALWFLLLPAYARAQGWRRWALVVVLTVGFAGLLVSFSRAAWLAFAAAVVLWLALERPKGLGGPPGSVRWQRLISLAVPGLLFLFFYRDLVLSRFLRLDTAIEAESITDRLRDARLALQLIADHPWRGVGLGAYHPAALGLNETASVVHNVPLLVAAELGLPALLLWGCLALAPFLRPAGAAAARLSPWLVMIAVSLFDVTLWWGHNWQTAILFALLAARVSEIASMGGDGGARPPDGTARPVRPSLWRR